MEGAAAAAEAGQTQTTSCSCLGRAAVPVKRVWRGLWLLRRRSRTTTGLGRLRKEVRTCEYSDVHVMWEMLSSTRGTGGGNGRPRPRRRRGPGPGSPPTRGAAWPPTALSASTSTPLEQKQSIN
ncbi:hypothetical protein U9M48_011380, partial [Paspalum notatum var. saurae]